MKLRIKYFLLVLIVFSFTFSGCKKQTENKLNGTWSFVNTADLNDKTNEKWTFNDDKITVTIYDIYGNFIVQGSGKYSLSVGLNKTTIKITDFNEISNHFYVGHEWQISKLTKSLMGLVYQEENSGLVYKEFVKSN